MVFSEADQPSPRLAAAPWGILLALAFFETSANGWRVLIYFDLLNVYRNPFSPNRNRALYAYPLAVLLMAGGLTAGLYFYANTVSGFGRRRGWQRVGGFLFWDAGGRDLCKARRGPGAAWRVPDGRGAARQAKWGIRRPDCPSTRCRCSPTATEHPSAHPQLQPRLLTHKPSARRGAVCEREEDFSPAEDAAAHVRVSR